MLGRFSRRRTGLFLAIFFLCTLTSCTDDKPNTRNTQKVSSSPVSQNKGDSPSESHALHRAFITKSDIIFSTLRNSTIALAKHISVFTTHPTEASLQACKKQLNNTHKDYLASYIFRNALTHANILDPELDLQHLSPEVVHTNSIRLDQYPILPGYIDSVDGYSSSGLVHSEQALTGEFLNSEHQFSDKAYVAIGFHALDYLLQGGKLESKRALDSFALKSTVDSEKNNAPQVRRLQYIALLGELILADVNFLYQSWVGETGFYRTTLGNLSEIDMSKLLKRTIEIEAFSLPKLKQILEDNPGNLAHNSLEIYELRHKVLMSLKSMTDTPSIP